MIQIIVDTNVLLRAIVRDNAAEFDLATRTLDEADILIVPVIVFCELAWVLRSRYHCDRDFVADAFRLILDDDRVQTQREAVLAGLRMLDDGGDFADAVVQHTGKILALEQSPAVYVSFDRKAVRNFARRGIAAMLLQ